MAMNIQEAYRTQNRLDQKRYSSRHIIIRTTNALNKDRILKALREHKFQPRLLYPAKLSITIDGETKVFHDKTKFTQYLFTNPALQRIIKGKLQHKDGNYAQKKSKKIIFQQT